MTAEPLEFLLARSRPSTALRSVVFVLVLAAVLAGCGRRGRLEPPPDPNAKPQEVSKTGLKKKPPNPPIRAPNTPFILDPLIK